MSRRATRESCRSTGLRRKSRPANSHSGRGRDHRADSIRFRRATVADSRALARAVFEALEDYAAFAPPGWTAPSLEEIDEEGHRIARRRGRVLRCRGSRRRGRRPDHGTPGHASAPSQPRADAWAHSQLLRYPRLLGHRARGRPAPRGFRRGARARLQRAAAFRARRSSSRATLLRARELASDRQPIRRPNLRVHNGRVPLQAPVDRNSARPTRRSLATRRRQRSQRAARGRDPQARVNASPAVQHIRGDVLEDLGYQDPTVPTPVPRAPLAASTRGGGGS